MIQSAADVNSVLIIGSATLCPEASFNCLEGLLLTIKLLYH